MATIATVSRLTLQRPPGWRRGRAARRRGGARDRRAGRQAARPGRSRRARSRAAARRASVRSSPSRRLSRNSPRYSSITTWKLVPPKPKALTAARRGASPGCEPGQRLVEQVERAAPAPCSIGFGLSTPRCGGSTRWCSASAALISPAMPAVALVWPIIVLTEPIAAWRGAAPVLADQLGRALQLGAVAGDGAGAVRLEQADARRPEPGHLVGAAHRPQLAGGQRRGQALGVAVAAAADALDHGIDPVAVALGIGQALQRHHRDALGDDDAVGRCVEGRAAAARRQRLRLAEAEVAERALHGVDAAGDDEVAAAPPPAR